MGMFDIPIDSEKSTGWYRYNTFTPVRAAPPKTIQTGRFGGENPAQTTANASYDIKLQGNTIKPGASIPCQYGRHIAFPDLIARKLMEVTNSSVINYFIFCLGQGSYDIESIRIGSSLIGDIPGISYEVVNPGGSVTLFPTVISKGSLASHSITLAGMADDVTPLGKTINKIAFDIQFSQGLYERSVFGILTSKSVTIQYGYAPVDANNIINGAVVMLGSKTYTGASAAPIDDTVEFTVAEGRWAAVVQRTDSESTNSNVADRVVLSSARGQSKAGHSAGYGDITIIAVKTVTQSEPFNLTDNKLSVVSTRRIKSWDGIWGASTASRSVVWAIADVVMANYGAGLGDEYLDLPALRGLDAELQARGDYFDARFDDREGVMDVIKKIAAAGRCEAYLKNGLLNIVRDKKLVDFDYLFTPSNIRADSFSVNYTPPQLRQADSLRVEYIDNGTWKTKSVDCNFGTNINEQTTSFFGVTDRDHAFREGMFYIAKSLYEHTSISFETGLEAKILNKGSHIIIAHDVDQFSQWGVIFNTIGVDTLVLSSPVNFNAQSIAFILISTNAGGVTAALQVAPGASPYEVIVSSGMPADISSVANMANKEPSRYVFVTAVSLARRARVDTIEHTGDAYAITCTVQDDRVHTADENALPIEVSANWAIQESAAAESSLVDDVSSGYSMGSLVVVAKTPGIETTYTASWSATGYKKFRVVWSGMVDGVVATAFFDVENVLSRTDSDGGTPIDGLQATIIPYNKWGVLLTGFGVTSVFADMIVNSTNTTIENLEVV